MSDVWEELDATYRKNEWLLDELIYYRRALRIACEGLESCGRNWFTPGGDPLEEVLLKQAKYEINKEQSK